METLRFWLHEISTIIRTLSPWIGDKQLIEMQLKLKTEKCVCQHSWKTFENTLQCISILQFKGKGPKKYKDWR